MTRHRRDLEGVWLGARSHLCHCFNGVSAPAGSRHAAAIRDMPVAPHVLFQATCVFAVCIFAAVGSSGPACLIVDMLLVSAVSQ